eukprot:Gb_23518 [translate_table: standard]
MAAIHCSFSCLTSRICGEKGFKFIKSSSVSMPLSRPDKFHGQCGGHLAGRVVCTADKVGFFGRLGRVIKEKAKSDVEKLFSGFSKTRDNLAVVDELLTYWNLADTEQVLDELEEVHPGLVLYLSDCLTAVVPPNARAPITSFLKILRSALYIYDIHCMRTAVTSSFQRCERPGFLLPATLTFGITAMLRFK